MDYQSNTKEVLERLKAIQALIAGGAFSDALVAGLNAGTAVMKRRIFNQSLAADGSSLGAYFSAQYERKRQRAGRQVGSKDLEFNGTVRRAIEVVAVNNSRAEVRFTDDRSADIGRWQEQQIANLRAGAPANEASGARAPIFEFSAAETAVVQTTTRELIRQRFNLPA